MPKSLTALPLLEYLSKQTECRYLSDLHFLTGPQKEKLALAVQSLDPAEASIAEWNDAASYITGKADVFKTSKDAVFSILQYCACDSQADHEETFFEKTNRF